MGLLGPLACWFRLGFVWRLPFSCRPGEAVVVRRVVASRVVGQVQDRALVESGVSSQPLDVAVRLEQSAQVDALAPRDLN